MAKQTQIAGTERKTIPELEEKAEAYRQLVADRMATQRREKEAKALLQLELERQAQAGNLRRLEEIDGDDLVDVYLYEGEDGETYRVRYRNKHDVKVNKARSDAE